MAGKLAEAYVEIIGRDDKLRGTLAGTRARLTSFATEMKGKLSLPVTLVGAVGSSAAVRFLTDSAMKAVDLGETMNKVKVTFGDAAGSIIAQAEDLSKQFGLVRNETLGAASNFGLVFQGMGVTTAASASLSAGLVKLAADASSFHNVPMEVALEKIRAGLVGEAEPLRAFGVNLSEAKVQAEAVRMGLARSTKDVGDYAKALARAALITEGLKSASGDLERTMDAPANALRKLQGQWAEFTTDLGQKTIPVLKDVVATLGQVNAAVSGATGGTGIVEAAANQAQGAIGAGGLYAKSGGKEIVRDMMIRLLEGAGATVGPIVGKDNQFNEAAGELRRRQMDDIDKMLGRDGTKPNLDVLARETQVRLEEAQAIAAVTGNLEELARLLAQDPGRKAAADAKAATLKDGMANLSRFRASEQSRDLGMLVRGGAGMALNGLLSGGRGMLGTAAGMLGRLKEGNEGRDLGRVSITDQMGSYRMMQEAAGTAGKAGEKAVEKSNEILEKIQGGIEKLIEKAGEAGQGAAAIMRGPE